MPSFFKGFVLRDRASGSFLQLCSVSSADVVGHDGELVIGPRMCSSVKLLMVDVHRAKLLTCLRCPVTARINSSTSVTFTDLDNGRAVTVSVQDFLICSQHCRYIVTG